MTRLEITFVSGRFVKFEDVEEKTLRQDGERLMFIHGERRDRTVVNMNNIEFFEIIVVD